VISSSDRLQVFCSGSTRSELWSQIISSNLCHKLSLDLCVKSCVCILFQFCVPLLNRTRFFCFLSRSVLCCPPVVCFHFLIFFIQASSSSSSSSVTFSCCVVPECFLEALRTISRLRVLVLPIEHMFADCLPRSIFRNNTRSFRLLSCTNKGDHQR
jgi:hypothetical protein